MEISVRGPWKDKGAEAADLLANAVILQTAGYVDEKAAALQDLLDSQDREIASIDDRLDRFEEEAQSEGISESKRTSLLALMGFAEQRRGEVTEERTTTRQLLTLANTVERGEQVTEARSVKVPAKSRRSAVVVGGLIGLLVGLGLALLWGPVVGRIRPRPA
jgi:hypothetical protein